MQVDRDRIDSRTLRVTERKGDRKILCTSRLTEKIDSRTFRMTERKGDRKILNK